MFRIDDVRYYVYMVKTSRNYFYTGISTNPERRCREHNEGKQGAKCLRGQRPVQLVWVSCVKTHSAALRLEKSIKKLRHEDKKRIVIFDTV